MWYLNLKKESTSQESTTAEDVLATQEPPTTEETTIMANVTLSSVAGFSTPEIGSCMIFSTHLLWYFMIQQNIQTALKFFNKYVGNIGLDKQ